MHEANAALGELGVDVGRLDGHKFAVGVGRSDTRRWLAVVACAQPRDAALRDGLTAEVRALGLHNSAPDLEDLLLPTLATVAARAGYRRLVMSTGYSAVEIVLYRLGRHLAGCKYGLAIGVVGRGR